MNYFDYILMQKTNNDKKNYDNKQKAAANRLITSQNYMRSAVRATSNI